MLERYQEEQLADSFVDRQNDARPPAPSGRSDAPAGRSRTCAPSRENNCAETGRAGSSAPARSRDDRSNGRVRAAPRRNEGRGTGRENRRRTRRSCETRRPRRHRARTCTMSAARGSSSAMSSSFIPRQRPCRRGRLRRLRSSPGRDVSAASAGSASARGCCPSSGAVRPAGRPKPAVPAARHPCA